jgi:hypothetical protein
MFCLLFLTRQQLNWLFNFYINSEIQWKVKMSKLDKLAPKLAQYYAEVMKLVQEFRTTKLTGHYLQIELGDRGIINKILKK